MENTEKKEDAKVTPQPNDGGDGKHCDKTHPDDPHYGQDGYYDDACNWVEAAKEQ